MTIDDVRDLGDAVLRVEAEGLIRAVRHRDVRTCSAAIRSAAYS